MSTDPDQSYAPLKIYGCKISYFTGKVETYLRFRNIPYEMGNYIANQKRMKQGAGVAQMPVIELADGRWMTDSTPMIGWLDERQSGQSIYPRDPVLNFIALLIEDYADEWLWRSAMHYRWSYRPDRQYAAEAIYNELIKGTLPSPRVLAINYLKWRQWFGFVKGDGVRGPARLHCDRTYLTALACLQTVFEKRPFLLGQRPTIADFGMMGPMLRHFGQDPTPQDLMRERAPAVYEWVARMWNAQPQTGNSALINQIDAPLRALLKEAVETNMSQHRQNAVAFDHGQSRFDAVIQGVPYQRIPVSRYRVWCLERLKRAWDQLGARDQDALKRILTSPEAAILWDGSTHAPSNYDPDQKAPFNRAINVFGSGVP